MERPCLTKPKNKGKKEKAYNKRFCSKAKFKGHGALLGPVFVFRDVLAPHGFACKAHIAPQEVDF